MSKWEVRENTEGYGFSPTDKPRFVIWRDGLPYSGGHSVDFCNRCIGWLSFAERASEPQSETEKR